MKHLYQFSIAGMTCHACESFITMDLEEMGEKPESITHDPGVMMIELDDARVEEVRTLIEREGKYRVTDIQQK